MYEKLYNKGHEDLKIYALVETNFNSYGVYLLEYSAGMPSGVREVIKNTRRKLKIKDDIVLPVLFQTDILSNQIRNDKIAHLPYAGYYIEVILENGKRRCVWDVLSARWSSTSIVFVDLLDEN